MAGGEVDVFVSCVQGSERVWAGVPLDPLAKKELPAEREEALKGGRLGQECWELNGLPGAQGGVEDVVGLAEGPYWSADDVALLFFIVEGTVRTGPTADVVGSAGAAAL